MPLLVVVFISPEHNVLNVRSVDSTKSVVRHLLSVVRRAPCVINKFACEHSRGKNLDLMYAKPGQDICLNGKNDEFVTGSAGFKKCHYVKF